MEEQISYSKYHKIHNLFQKLKKDKKALIIIFTGMLGMLLIVFSGDKEKAISYDKINKNNSELIFDSEAIKQELTDLIESINGAGKTTVMITYKSDEETVFAFDSEELIKEGETKSKKEHIVVENDSEEYGLPVKVIYPEVQGVAVVCEGGDNQIIKEKIFTMVTALFGISSNSISVAAMT